MTSPQPPAPAPSPGPGSPPPAAPGEGTQQHQIDTLRAEQQRQGGVLDELLSLVKGTGGDGPGKNTPPAPPAPDITEQMRQAVRDVQAENAAPPPGPAGPPQPPVPERRPREGSSFRQGARRLLVGKDDRS